MTPVRVRISRYNFHCLNNAVLQRHLPVKLWYAEKSGEKTLHLKIVLNYVNNYFI